MTETTEAVEGSENPEVVEVVETEVAAEVTEAPVEAAPAESFVFERPIQTVGRRKEAVVRVRPFRVAAPRARPVRCGWASRGR